MQNYIPQNPYQQPMYRQFSHKLFPISNDSEMASMAVDYSGNPTYFHNQATDEIYIKYFELKTGLTPIIKYVREDKLVQPKQEQAQPATNYDEKFNQLNAKFDTVLALLSKPAVKPEVDADA